MTEASSQRSKPAASRFDGLAASVWRSSRRYRPVLVLLVAVGIYFTFTDDKFLTNTNIQNILTSSSVVWVVAIGMTLVLISAGLDLSVAATGTLAGLCLAHLLQAGVPGWIAVVLTVIFGALIGGVANGILIGPLKLSVFVVTLATLTSFTGIVSIWSHTQSIYVTAPVVSQIAIDKYLGVSGSIWVMVIVYLVVAYLQSWTYFGRDVFAIGGSKQAAQLSGIRPARTIIGVYAVVGACAALAGVVAVGRTGAVVPQVDDTLALQAIAAVLLGGTSLTGGSGGVGGTAIGVLFLGVLQNGLSLNGVSSFWQQVVTGVILVAAVLLDRLEHPGSRLNNFRRGNQKPASGGIVNSAQLEPPPVQSQYAEPQKSGPPLFDDESELDVPQSASSVKADAINRSGDAQNL